MKKLLSIFLSLVLLVSVFSCLPAAALSEEDISVTSSTSKLNSVESEGYLLSDTASLSATKTISGSSPQSETLNGSANIKNETSYSGEATAGQSHYCPSGKVTSTTLDETRWLEIKYDLGAVADISDILVTSANNGGFTFGHYKLYASADVASPELEAYGDTYLIYDFTRTNNKDMSQTFSFSDGALSARYITLRIIAPIGASLIGADQTALETALGSNASWGSVYLRLYKFLVYGKSKERLILNPSLSAADSGTQKIPDIEKYGSLTNTNTTANFTLTAVHYKNDVIEGEPVWTSTESSSPSRLYNGANASGDDQQCCSSFFFADKDNSVVFIDGTRRYLDYIYDLGAVCDISYISVVHGNNDALMTGRYQLYASKTESRKFTTDDLLIDFTNSKKSRSQTFSTTQGNKVYARYVALRILNPFQYGVTYDLPLPGGWPFRDNYVASARIAEFQVYGEYSEKMVKNSTWSKNDKTTISFPGKGSVSGGTLADYNSITNPANADNFSLSVIRYKNDGAGWVKYDTPSWNVSALYDGIGNRTDNFPGNGFFVDKENSKLLLDGTRRYIDFVYDLGAIYDISDIAVVNGSTDGGLGMGHYKIYASEDEPRNFTEDDLLIDYINDETYRSQTFSTLPKKEIHARFVCLRVINPVPMKKAAEDYIPSANDLNQDHIVAVRLGQFQVYGTRLPGQATLSGGYIEGWLNYKEKVDISKNLLANQQPASATYINTYSGITSPTATTTMGDKLTSTINAYDGQTQGNMQTSFVEHDGTKVTALRDDETKQYVQLDYELTKPAKITEFAVLGHRETHLSPSHFKVSFADTKDELFTDAAYTVEVKKSNYEYVIGKIPEEEIPTAKWASIRVICGVTDSVIGGTMRPVDYYSRVSHFLLRGEWTEGLAEDNLTVTSNKDFITPEESKVLGQIDNNGNSVLGTSYITVTAPEAQADADGHHTFIGWFDGDAMVSDSTTFDYYLTDSAKTLTAKYESSVSYTVTYLDKSGTKLYETYVKANSTLSKEQIQAASLKVPELFGYVRRLDENGLQLWSEDDRSIITADLVLTPVYTYSEETYIVSITDSSGETITQNLLFDQKLTLKDDGAFGWMLDGKVISYDSAITLYVSGNMELSAIKEELEKTATLTIMNTAKSIDTLSVLAHINNPDNKAIIDAGIIFVSGATYDAVGDVDWTANALKGFASVNINLKNISGDNFMGTLIGIPKDREVVRVAKAYVTFEDGTTIYSSATAKNTFSPSNPLITTEQGGCGDPWIVYHEGYYYHVYNRSDGVYLSKSNSLFEIGNRDIEVKIHDNSDSSNETQGSWFAPELHYIDEVWYVYAAPAHADNAADHDMYVLSFEGDSPLADGENTKYTPRGFMSGLNDSATLNIDGTYFGYEGKHYFIWSDQGSLKIANLSKDADGFYTILSDAKTISRPTYDWEMNVYSLNEGPAILEHNGKVFLSFSASDSQSDWYAIGILEFAGGDPLDASNWTKWEEPVLEQDRELGIYGPGHNSFTKVLINGNWVDYIVYHCHDKSVTAGEVATAWNARTVHAQPVYWDIDGKPVFGKVSHSVY